MGTHGLYGYILNGLYYLMYVHYDGNMLMSIMKRESYIILQHYGSIEKVKEQFFKIKWKTNTIKPTKKEIEILKPWTNLEIDYKSTNSWYCLLCRCQKSLIHTLESGYILLYELENNKPTSIKPDYFGFLCWWNLDTNTIEFYNGNQLLEKMYPDELINLRQKNFPIKTYNSIVSNFYNHYEKNCIKIIKLNKLLENIKKTELNKLDELDELDESDESDELDKSNTGKDIKKHMKKNNEKDKKIIKYEPDEDEYNSDEDNSDEDNSDKSYNSDEEYIEDIKKHIKKNNEKDKKYILKKELENIINDKIL